MEARPWWQDGVLYQIYPRSFADSNGDGVGDLRGIVERLDHLAWLGVDGLWLSPVHPSPNADWGYDVADYQGIHPELGTLADLDELVAKAADHGMRVVLDLVPNHTSDQHPWFVDARSGAGAEHRDYYVWADGQGEDGSEPPNNWVSSFGGPAWTRDETSGQWYLHNFLPQQPDLNWWEPRVADEFDRILRFWFDRGVAGFRIDVCHMIVKDRELRDNPPAEDGDHWSIRLRGQRTLYNADRPEVHDVLRRWRAVAEEYDEARLLLGEVYLMDVERVAAFFGDGDELQLAFNFGFVHTRFEADAMRDAVAFAESTLAPKGWSTWTGSNHDVSRFPTRWAGGDEGLARCALMMLMTLRGTPVLYYGDEIGMTDAPIEAEQLQDPVGVRYHPFAGRDPERTPMVWSDDPGAGFTDPMATPWLPIGDTSRNVEDQRDDPASMLHLTRDLIALRRESEDLRRGVYQPLDSPEGVWAWRRGEGTTVVLNLSDGERTVEGLPAGTIRIATDRARDGEAVDGTLTLGPAEGAIVVS